MEVKTFQYADNGYIVRGVSNKNKEKFFSLSDIALLFGYKKGLNFIPKAMALGVKKIKIEIPDKKGRLQPMAFIAEKDILKILSKKKDLSKFENQIKFMKCASDQLTELAVTEEPAEIKEAPTKSDVKKNLTTTKKVEKKPAEKKAAKTVDKKTVEKVEKKAANKSVVKEETTSKKNASAPKKKTIVKASEFAGFIANLIRKENITIIPD